jgi:hypothetical protein
VLVWTQGLEEKSILPVGDRTPVVQSVLRHYTVALNRRNTRVEARENMGEDVRETLLLSKKKHLAFRRFPENARSSS